MRLAGETESCRFASSRIHYMPRSKRTQYCWAFQSRAWARPTVEPHTLPNTNAGLRETPVVVAEHSRLMFTTRTRFAPRQQYPSQRQRLGVGFLCCSSSMHAHDAGRTRIYTYTAACTRASHTYDFDYNACFFCVGPLSTQSKTV